MNNIAVHPIHVNRLTAIWQTGRDEFGHPLEPQIAPGNPMRCCLGRSGPDDLISVISYAPISIKSPWAEAGPVFIHAEPCDGPATPDLPADMRTGPRVLRSYRHDASMDYEGNVVTAEGEDIEAELIGLLARSGIHEVHVRALKEQCFTYRVTKPGVEVL